MAVKSTSKIEFKVGLDENKVPEELHWSAEDSEINDAEAKALMVSVWNADSQETLRLDLWTKDMQIDQMKKFYHQTLVSMADSFERATNDDKMSATMRDFCDYFAEKLELKKQ